MSGTAKTLLIVGGVAVGAYVLLKAVAPGPSRSSYSLFGGSSSSTAAGITQGAIQGFANIFSSTGTSSHPSSFDSSATSVRQSDAAGISQYDAQGTSDTPVVGIAGIDY